MEMKTFSYYPVDVATQKISAIKLIRQFTLEVFGVGSCLKESKDLVEHIAQEARAAAVRAAYERLAVKNAVIAMLKVTPLQRRRSLLANLATTLNGEPHFNQYDEEYRVYLD